MFFLRSNNGLVDDDNQQVENLCQMTLRCQMVKWSFINEGEGLGRAFASYKVLARYVCYLHLIFELML